MGCHQQDLNPSLQVETPLLNPIYSFVSEQASIDTLMCASMKLAHELN